MDAGCSPLITQVPAASAVTVVPEIEHTSGVSEVSATAATPAATSGAWPVRVSRTVAVTVTGVFCDSNTEVGLT